MAFRWLARRLLNSLRSPMMWSMARRWSSRFRRRRSSVSTCARSRCSAVTAAPGSATAACRSCVAVSGIAITLSRASAFRLGPQALNLLFEGDHLQLAADDYFFEFLEVQDLLLELALGLLQVANHLLVFAHVAQDADGADHPAARVAQRRGVEGRGDHLPAGAAGVQVRVAGDAALDDLAEGRGELACLLGADEAGQRLLEQLVGPEAEQRGDGVIGLQDLALEVGDEDRVGGVLNEALGVRAGLVELAHVAQDTDRADHLAVRVAQRRSVERRGDHFPAGAARVEAGVARYTALHNLPEGGQELPSLIGGDDARERLLDQLVRAEAQEGEDGVVGLQDLPLEIGHEHGVRRILDQALGVGAGLVELPHVAQDADHADRPAVRIAQGGGVQARGDNLAAGTAGFRTTFRMTPRSTTSRSAAVNSRVSSGLMKRESDCSSTSSWRNPSSWETASLAWRILPSRSETNTGSARW